MTIAKRSPSQFATWLDCPRKWAFSRVLPSGPKPAAELGQRVHTVAEAWLRDGTLPPDTVEGRIFLAGVQHLPEPGTVLVESDFRFERPTWIAHGRRDFVWDTGVGDHKTTSGLQWAKSEEDLRTDPQGVIYAASVMLEQNRDDAELLWVYYGTGNALGRSKRVHLRVHIDDVARELERFDAIAVEMSEINRPGVNPKEVDYNASACAKYGGCEYVEVCGLTSQERFGSIMSQGSLKDKLKSMMKPLEEAKAEEPKPTPAASGLASKLKKPSPVAPKHAESVVEKILTEVESTKPDPVEELAARTVREEAPTPPAGINPRDLMAANAMAGILSNPANTTWSADRVASESYDLADAMIKARG